MTRYNEVAKTLKILPKMMRHLDGSFTPQMDIRVRETEFKTLMEIKNNPRKPMKHYVDAAGIENGSFTYLADKLETKGLIRRKIVQDDKRITVLELTDKGLQVTKELKRQFIAHIVQTISVLEESDLDQLVQATGMLEKLLRKLENR